MTLALALDVLVMWSWCAPARADGGMVRLVEQHGDYRISVFTAPNPLRAGPVDVSVLVQDAAGQVVREAEIAVTLTTPDRPGESIHAVATTEAATNKLLRSAMVELPEQGEWNVQVVCVTPRGNVQTGFAIEAGPPLPPWLTVWPWFTWPVVAVLLFGVHRRLAARKSLTLEKPDVR